MTIFNLMTNILVVCIVQIRVPLFPFARHFEGRPTKILLFYYCENLRPAGIQWSKFLIKNWQFSLTDLVENTSAVSSASAQSANITIPNPTFFILLIKFRGKQSCFHFIGFFTLDAPINSLPKLVQGFRVIFVELGDQLPHYSPLIKAAMIT